MYTSPCWAQEPGRWRRPAGCCPSAHSQVVVIPPVDHGLLGAFQMTQVISKEQLLSLAQIYITPCFKCMPMLQWLIRTFLWKQYWIPISYWSLCIFSGDTEGILNNIYTLKYLYMLENIGNTWCESFKKIESLIKTKKPFWKKRSFSESSRNY